MTGKPGLTYRDAGVDIDAGEALVEKIKGAANSTRRPGVLSGLGGFGALFELPLDRYTHPVLVSGTDGVGTKLRLAIDTRRVDGVGIDLVAMCVNDIAVCGAEPLFFLDYYATGKLDVDVATRVVEGIAEGCRQSGAALVGGETAEMPDMYPAGDFDLAGFSVGIVEKANIIDGSQVKAGDKLVGVASTGPHSNGYSLIRRILDVSGHSADDAFANGTLADALLTPTRIYVRDMLALNAATTIHAWCHVTGGGLLDNLPRVLPDDCMARIETEAWQRPPIFDWLQTQGNVSQAEMHRTFNCGIGMVAVVPDASVEAVREQFGKTGVETWVIGEIQARPEAADAVELA